jgi:hypothetical protein
MGHDCQKPIAYFDIKPGNSKSRSEIRIIFLYYFHICFNSDTIVALIGGHDDDHQRLTVFKVSYPLAPMKLQ